MGRRDYDNLIQPETTGAVRAEVLTILRLVSRSLGTAAVEKAFDDVAALYRGNFPGYRSCTTAYHDLGHTAGVFLAMARLIHGAAVQGHAFADRQIVSGLIAALMHDVGYIQEAHDTRGTGAKYAAVHVDRSIAFLARHGGRYQLVEAEVAHCGAIIRYTDIAREALPARDLEPWIELFGKMLGTADLLAQLADRAYLEKLRHLCEENREAGVGDCESHLDILQKAVPFYEFADARLKTDLGGTERFMAAHFSARIDVSANLYRIAIESQKRYLIDILNLPKTDLRKHLRRGRSPADR